MKRIKKDDVSIGDLIKTKVSEDILVVCDLSKFNPVDHLFYKQKLLAKPMMAFRPQHETTSFLLGNNRLMAMKPDGSHIFPTLKDIYYIIKNEQ